MKSKILKSVQQSAIAASILTSCLVLPNAYAKDVQLDYVHKNSSIGRINIVQSEMDDLKKLYGDIGYFKQFRQDDGLGAMLLHGALDWPKWGAFTIGVIPKDESGNDLTQENLTFKSQGEAIQFCKNLSAHSPIKDNEALLVHDDLIHRVIMVPYTIAYDTGSQQAGDGTSVPATKYVMCPNYGGTGEWKLDPSRDKSENEVTGIVSSTLNDAQTEYTVTCMPAANRPEITLTRLSVFNGVVAWSDGTYPGTFVAEDADLTNIHQFNKLIGAQYCPVSPA